MHVEEGFDMIYNGEVFILNACVVSGDHWGNRFLFFPFFKSEHYSENLYASFIIFVKIRKFTNGMIQSYKIPQRCSAHFESPRC